MPQSRQAFTHCICDRKPAINRDSTRHHHPSRWAIKVGAVCWAVIGLLLFWFVIDLFWYWVGGLAGLTVLIFVVKWLRGHSFLCAARDAPLVALGVGANILEGINPANWL